VRLALRNGNNGKTQMHRVIGYTIPRSQSYVATLWGICGLLVLGALLTALLIKPWDAAHEKVLRRDEA
jgi:hypothetical protein